MRYLACFAMFMSLIMNYGYYPLLISLFLNGTFLFLRSKIYKPHFSVFFLFLYYTIFVFFTFNTHQDLSYFLYVANFIYIINMLIFVFVLTTFQKHEIVKILDFIIKLLVFTLIFQHVIYIFFNVYVDFHKIITLGAYESRFYGGMFSDYGLIRPTGFSIEPSNFSIMIIYLVFFDFYLSKNIRKANYQLLGSCLTLSFAAIGIVAALILILNYRKLFSIKIKNLFVFFVLSIFSVMFLYVFYYRMTSGVDYDAIGSRMKLFSYLKEQPLQDLLLGNGVFFYSGEMNFNGFLLTEAEIKDTGLLVNLFFSLGIVGLSLFLFYILRFSDGWLVFLFSILLMIMKFDFGQPIFWFFVFFIPYVSEKYTHEKKYYYSGTI